MSRDLDRYGALARMTELIAARETAAMAPLVRQEALLRDALARLRRPAAEPEGFCALDCYDTRALHAQWTSRRITALNEALARCLAQKEEQRQALALASGRAEVACELRDRAESGARARRHRVALEAALSLGMLR